MTKKQRAEALIPYLRQSKKHDGPLSLDGQRANIQAWAQANGVDLLPEVVERGVSGNKSWRERDLGETLERVRAGSAGGVVVAYASRLSRENGLARAEFLEEWKGLKDARLVCVQESVDQARMEPKMFQFTLDLHGAMARLEWETRREGFVQARKGAVASGVHVCSTVPVGYSASDTGRLNGNGNAALGGLVPNADAPAVRALFELKASGGSWTEAVELLESAGAPNRSGGRWTHGSAAAIVRNRVYLGEARHGEFVNPEAHEAIVDPTTWRRAQPGTRGKRQSAGALLSGGILRCASCGRALVPSATDGRYRCRYRQIAGPAKGGHNHCEEPASAKASDVEALVTARLYADEAAKAAPPAPSLEPLRTAAATARSRYQALLDTDLLDIDPAAFSERARELKQAAEQAEDDLAAAEREGTRADVEWEGMTPAERRRWLAGSGVTVLVRRGREPIAERATFVHRDPKAFAEEWRAAWRADAGL